MGLKSSAQQKKPSAKRGRNLYIQIFRQMVNMQNFKELQKLNTNEIKLPMNKWAYETGSFQKKKHERPIAIILKSVQHP